MLLFWSFYSSKNPEKQNIMLTKTLSNTTVLNINNNKKKKLKEHETLKTGVMTAENSALLCYILKQKIVISNFK